MSDERFAQLWHQFTTAFEDIASYGREQAGILAERADIADEPLVILSAKQVMACKVAVEAIREIMALAERRHAESN